MDMANADARSTREKTARCWRCVSLGPAKSRLEKVLKNAIDTVPQSKTFGDESRCEIPGYAKG